MNDVLILSARRTPVGRAGGVFRDLGPEDLAAAALRAAAAGLGPDACPGDVLLAHTVGPGGNLARLALLQAGLPVTVPGITLDRQCAGGLEAVRLAASLIRSGDCRSVLAGGVESCSRESVRLRADPAAPRRPRFAPDALGDPDVGPAADALASAWGITRQAQDGWAAESVRRALAAVAAGGVAAEIEPVAAPSRSGEARLVAGDETPRRAIPPARLAGLTPAFSPGGTVTAGNACRRSDGAAALLLASAEEARRLGRAALARVVAGVTVGGDPRLPGAAVIAALAELGRRTGLPPAAAEWIEVNEPFAAVPLAASRALDLPRERVNPCGGALAIGHPYAATGAIQLTRLVHGLRRTGGRYGVAAAPGAGGLGCAVLVERA